MSRGPTPGARALHQQNNTSENNPQCIGHAVCLHYGHLPSYNKCYALVHGV